MRTGQRNPSRASSGRSERARSATPARELPAASDALSAEEKPAQGKPQGVAQSHNVSDISSDKN